MLYFASSSVFYTCLSYNMLAQSMKKKTLFIVALQAFSWERVCLRRRYPVMALYTCLLRICYLVVNVVLRSLPSNWSTSYIMFWNYKLLETWIETSNWSEIHMHTQSEVVHVFKHHALKVYGVMEVKLLAVLVSALVGDVWLPSCSNSLSLERAPGTNWICDWVIPRGSQDVGAKIKILACLE
jgi:hypothetical protein